MRIEVAPTFITDKRSPSHKPGMIGKCVSGIKPLAKRTAFTRWANKLAIEGLSSFLLGREYVAVTLYSFKRNLRIQFCVWHRFESATPAGISQ